MDVVRAAEQDLIEAQIRSTISKVGFERFMIALHNSLTHGEVFENDVDCGISEEQLETVFECIDLLCEIASEIMK